MEQKSLVIGENNYKDFSYANINENSPIYTEKFATAYSGNFILFACLEVESPNQNVKHGWKFHIALDDTDLSNVEKAWNVVKNILIKYKVHTSKVIQKGVSFTGKDPLQCGKQITIYQHCDHPEKGWPKILSEITKALIKAHIKVGTKSPEDKQILGSSYFTYRNDATKKGGYQKAEPGLGYNPHNYFDPFTSLFINEDNIKKEIEEEEAEEALLASAYQQHGFFSHPQSEEEELNTALAVSMKNQNIVKEEAENIEYSKPSRN